MLENIQPVIIFIFGTICGVVINKIVPVEYKIYRKSQIKDEQEVNDWYKETLPVVNKLAIHALRLWVNKQPETQEGPFAVYDFGDDIPKEKISTLSEELLDKIYGAPEEIDVDPSNVQFPAIVGHLSDGGISATRLYSIMEFAVYLNIHTKKRQEDILPK